MNELQNQWYKKWWGVLLIILACLVFILIVSISIKVKDITSIQKSDETNYLSLAKNNLSPAELAFIEGTESNYWTGTATPKITIVEFGDYACTYCKKAHSKIREISNIHKDTVKFIFRDYPINTDQSVKLAQASRCAGEQGLFWSAHDKLFLNAGIKEDSEIKNSLKSIGLNMTKFNKCYDDQKYLANIKKDLSDGNHLGITGTPTWFINGNIIKGDIPYDTFNEIINQLNKVL